MSLQSGRRQARRDWKESAIAGEEAFDVVVIGGGAAGCVIGTVFARETLGLITAQAAPAPNSCANFRREIETVFM